MDDITARLEAMRQTAAAYSATLMRLARAAEINARDNATRVLFPSSILAHDELLALMEDSRRALLQALAAGMPEGESKASFMKGSTVISESGKV